MDYSKFTNIQITVLLGFINELDRIFDPSQYNSTPIIIEFITTHLELISQRVNNQLTKWSIDKELTKEEVDDFCKSISNIDLKEATDLDILLWNMIAAEIIDYSCLNKTARNCITTLYNIFTQERMSRKLDIIYLCDLEK